MFFTSASHFVLCCVTSSARIFFEDHYKVSYLFVCIALGILENSGLSCTYTGTGSTEELGRAI